VRFTSAYGEPVCSSARAALLTGRRPVHTGIGTTVEPGGVGLSYGEVLLPEALGRPSAAIGKWHLNLGDPHAPLRHGFDRFDGILDNPTDYRDWPHVSDGTVELSTEYLVTAQADAAIDALDALPEPWFLYVAFSGAHGPVHTPPGNLFSVADPSDVPGQGDAMIEALDHELGRLLDALDPGTTVLVTSDNGTSGDLVRPPADPRRAKSSVYAGGTHVPLIVAGPGIGPGVSDQLVHATDVFPTVLAIAGIDVVGLALDGTSFAPRLYGATGGTRTCVVVEQFQPTGRRDTALLDAEWTLVRHKRGPDELYRRDPLAPCEAEDLAGSDDPAAEEALARLRRLLRQASAGR
jgi:arylsulfatase A-like enzyme